MLSNWARRGAGFDAALEVLRPQASAGLRQSDGAVADPRSSKADNIVVWRTIKGVAQAGNMVGGIAGGGQPWSTREGEVLVELDAPPLAEL